MITATAKASRSGCLDRDEAIRRDPNRCRDGAGPGRRLAATFLGNFLVLRTWSVVCRWAVVSHRPKDVRVTGFSLGQKLPNLAIAALFPGLYKALSGRKPQLLQCPRDVVVDGSGRQEEPLGDAGAGETSGGQFHDLVLAG